MLGLCNTILFANSLVDDGTAVIPCTRWKEDGGAGTDAASNKSSGPELNLSLGQLVSVRGGISEFRGKRQLIINSISPLLGVEV